MPTGRPPFNLLSVVANVERHKLASAEPWLLLLDLAWPGNNPLTDQHVRLVRNLDPITFDAGDGNGPQTYTPFNFQMGDLTVSSNGSVPSCEVQASNVMRALQQTLEQYAGAVGASLTLYAVNAANPAGEPDLTLAFTVTQTTSDAKLVHFKLGASSPLRRLFPINMYRPNFCIWQFNSPALQQATAAAIAAMHPLADPAGAQCGYTGTGITAATTSGSPSITVTSAAGINLGDVVWGPGIPSGTNVTTVTSVGGATLTLSANATATASGVTLADGGITPAAAISLTASTTSGSASVVVTSAAGINVGDVITGPGIPTGSGNVTVLAVGSATVTLSANATATASGVSLTDSQPTCSHTIDGITGCQAHNNLVRIGTFPGIDSNGAAAAGVV